MASRPNILRSAWLVDLNLLSVAWILDSIINIGLFKGKIYS
jgi:hypothetical protein